MCYSMETPLHRSSSRNDGSSLSGYGTAFDVGGSPQISTATASHQGAAASLVCLSCIAQTTTRSVHLQCFASAHACTMRIELSMLVAGWPSEYAPAGSFVSSDSHQQSSVSDQHEVAMQAETPRSQVCSSPVTASRAMQAPVVVLSSLCLWQLSCCSYSSLCTQDL